MSLGWFAWKMVLVHLCRRAAASTGSGLGRRCGCLRQRRYRRRHRTAGNALGKDPIHERFGEEERTYDSVPQSYRDEARARAVQAAVGLKQLERIESLNGARTRNGRALDAGLAHVPGLNVPSYPEGSEPIYMSFVVHHPDRDALMTALRNRGVDTTTGYMSDLSDHPLFQANKRPCPNAKKAMAELLHIPVHPNLSEADVAHLIESVRAATLETLGPNGVL